MCKKQSDPWLPNQLRSFINFFLSCQSFSPFWIAERRRGRGKDGGWVGRLRPKRKKKKEKKNRLKEEKKEKNLTIYETDENKNQHVANG